MPNIEVSNELWEEITAQQLRFNFPTQFVPFDEAVECMIEGNKTAFRDWLADSTDVPRIYLFTPEAVRRVQ